MDASHFDRFTRHLGRRTTRRTALSSALVSLGISSLASPQDAAPTPDATPIAEGEKPVLMFVQTFASGRGEVHPGATTPVADGTATPAGGAPFLLTLEGHSGQTVYFSDRPDRVVGSISTDAFLGGFDFSIPPNAALVAEFPAGQGVVVLKLIEPCWDVESGTLTYAADVLAGYQGNNLNPVLAEQIAARLPALFGPAALFIDSEMLITFTTAVYDAHLSLTCTSYPPPWINVCGFNQIPEAIGGNPEIGERTGIAWLYIGDRLSSYLFCSAWITGDCIRIYPQPGGDTFPPGEYRLEITTPSSGAQTADFAYFEL